METVGFCAVYCKRRWDDVTVTYTLVRTALVFAVRRMSALGAQLLSKL